MAWIDGDRWSEADRGVIEKVIAVSRLDSIRFDMIHV